MTGRARPRFALAMAMAVLGAAALAGCNAVGGITGAVAGAASGGASGNPGVGIAVAIAVRSAVDAALDRLDRSLKDDEQQRIAERIGATPVGAQSFWQVRNRFGYQDSQGRVQVLRTFTTALVDCREALFSVDDDEASAATAPLRFVTTVCRDAQQPDWRWALAEPAVARWGALQ